jgi:hypothetical protein
LAALRSVAVFRASVALSAAYLHARVTLEVKSSEKDDSSELFTGTLTG